jgi:hypothetical protein
MTEGGEREKEGRRERGKKKETAKNGNPGRKETKTSREVGAQHDLPPG